MSFEITSPGMRFSVRHRGDTTKGEITTSTYDIAVEVQDAPYSAREINQPSWTLDGDVTAHWNGVAFTCPEHVPHAVRVAIVKRIVTGR